MRIPTSPSRSASVNFGIFLLLLCTTSTRVIESLSSSSSSSFLSTTTALSIPSKTRTQSSIITMYFDDVSRHVTEFSWTPSSSSFLGASCRRRRMSFPSYTEQKRDAIQQRLLPFTAKLALEMSEEDVLRRVEEWATTCGVVTVDDGALHVSHLCNAATLLDVMDQFWNHMAKQSTQQEPTSNSPQQQQQQQQQQHHNQQPEFTPQEDLALLVIPHCPNLYRYATMVQVVQILVKSLAECDDNFDVPFNIFHPTYKDSPKLWSPERHAPFPVLGYRIIYNNNNKNNSPETLTSQQPLSPLDLGQTSALEHQREILEQLFASPAAAMPFNDATNLDFLEEVSDETIQEQCEAWIALFQTNNDAEPNYALRYSDTIVDWHVCRESTAVSAYQNVWKALKDLQERSGGERDTPTVHSVMLAMPSFHPHNAQAFCRFAVTINAALRLISRHSNDKFFLEVFHGEYTSRHPSTAERQSPFPMLQLCWQREARTATRKRSGPV